jgi:hypothetical protein
VSPRAAQIGESGLGGAASVGGGEPRLESPRALRELGELAAPERALLVTLNSGAYHQCGEGGLPAAGNAGRAIRAGLLRLLLLGDPDVLGLHEKGLRLRGGWVTGVLDVEGCQALRGASRLRIAASRRRSLCDRRKSKP